MRILAPLGRGEKRLPLAVVQSIVGHSTSLMTRHYYHESEAALKSAIAALPAL